MIPGMIPLISALAPLENAGVTFIERTATASSTSHTLSGVDFGDEPLAPNERWMICCAQTFGATPTSLTGTPTIGGVNASIIYNAAGPSVSGAAYRHGWFAAQIPSGTTGDITFSTVAAVIPITTVYRAINLDAASVSDSDINSAAAVATLAIDCPAGGAILGNGFCTYSSSGPTSGPFANLTSLASTFVTGGGFNVAASVFASAQTGLNVTFDPAPNTGALRTIGSVISIPYAI